MGLSYHIGTILSLIYIIEYFVLLYAYLLDVYIIQMNKVNVYYSNDYCNAHCTMGLCFIVIICRYRLSRTKRAYELIIQFYIDDLI